MDLGTWKYITCVRAQNVQPLSPAVRYQFNHLYLAEACRMMFETDRNGERRETKMLYEEILKFIEEHREEFEEWLENQK